MTYASALEVLEHLGHSASSEATDLGQRVAAAVGAATAQIEADTGRVFTQSTSARTFSIDRVMYGRELPLPDFRSVSSVKIDDDDDGVFEVTIGSSAYEADRHSDRDGWPFSSIRLLHRTFPCSGRRRRRVEVTADWGWDAVPAPIGQACRLLAAQLAQRGSSALFGTQSFGEIGAAPIRNRDPHYAALIAPYVIHGIA